MGAEEGNRNGNQSRLVTEATLCPGVLEKTCPAVSPAPAERLEDVLYNCCQPLWKANSTLKLTMLCNGRNK